SQEWRKWRHGMSQLHQDIVQRTVGVTLVGVITALPEAPPGTANIPVRSVIDKWQYWLHGVRYIVAVHVVFDFLNQLMDTRYNPNIQWISKLLIRILRPTIPFPAVDLRIQRKEVEHIPNH